MAIDRMLYNGFVLDPTNRPTMRYTYLGWLQQPMGSLRYDPGKKKKEKKRTSKKQKQKQEGAGIGYMDSRNQ